MKHYSQGSHLVDVSERRTRREIGCVLIIKQRQGMAKQRDKT
jgi:hypothetical protein